MLSVILINKPSSVPATDPLTVFKMRLPNWNPEDVEFVRVLFCNIAATAVAPLAVVVPLANWKVEDPLTWKFKKSAAEPAPEFGALIPIYVPPLVAALPDAIALPTLICEEVALFIGVPVTPRV